MARMLFFLIFIKRILSRYRARSFFIKLKMAPSGAIFNLVEAAGILASLRCPCFARKPALGVLPRALAGAKQRFAFFRLAPRSVPDAGSIIYNYVKQKNHRMGGFYVWWRRRELNPRPQALRPWPYMLSLIFWF